jgi:hypothetical protein
MKSILPLAGSALLVCGPISNKISYSSRNFTIRLICLGVRVTQIYLPTSQAIGNKID